MTGNFEIKSLCQSEDQELSKLALEELSKLVKKYLSYARDSDFEVSGGLNETAFKQCVIAALHSKIGEEDNIFSEFRVKFEDGKDGRIDILLIHDESKVGEEVDVAVFELKYIPLPCIYDTRIFNKHKSIFGWVDYASRDILEQKRKVLDSFITEQGEEIVGSIYLRILKGNLSRADKDSKEKQEITINEFYQIADAQALKYVDALIAEGFTPQDEIKTIRSIHRYVLVGVGNIVYSG